MTQKHKRPTAPASKKLPAAKKADEGRVTRRIEKPKAGSRAAREAQTTMKLGDAGDFELPELSLLKPAPADSAREKINEDALEQNARMLESVLNEFGVQGEITKVRPGPVVTLSTNLSPRRAPSPAA